MVANAARVSLLLPSANLSETPSFALPLMSFEH
jgi:hypothetical protein